MIFFPCSIINCLTTSGANGAEVNIMETTINSVIKILLFIGGIFLVDILFRKANVWLQRRGTYFFDKLHTKELRLAYC